MTDNCDKIQSKNTCCFIAVLSVFFILICNISGLFTEDKGTCFFVIINEVFKIGFPMLMMCAGEILLSEKRWLSIKRVYKGPLLSLLILTAIWSIIYAVFNIWYYNLDLKTALLSIVYAYSKPVSGHLQLAYTFIAFLVLLPLLKIFTSKATEKLVLYAVIIWVISGVILPFLGSANKYFTLTNDAQINIYYGYLGFFLLGYYVKIKRFDPGIFLTLTVFLFSMGTSITLSTVFSYDNDGFLSALTSITSPLNVLSAFCGYLTLKSLFNGIKGSELFEKIANNLFYMETGVYMCHMIFAMTIKKILPLNNILGFIICLIFAIPVSYIFTYLTKKKAPRKNGVQEFSIR